MGRLRPALYVICNILTPLSTSGENSILTIVVSCGIRFSFQILHITQIKDHKQTDKFFYTLVDMDGVVLSDVCRADDLERNLSSSWHRLG